MKTSFVATAITALYAAVVAASPIANNDAIVVRAPELEQRDPALAAKVTHAIRSALTDSTDVQALATRTAKSKRVADPEAYRLSPADGLISIEVVLVDAYAIMYKHTNEHDVLGHGYHLSKE
ncbi:hypothetical protein F4818DRAFT_436785 [Hypoxylon cercidicola]|nr:hypothetical protein F4818DRAFT_436785 [Hypoxylon cercidicola]